MKKKIKDLTLEECRNICAKHSSCSNCLFFDHNWRDCMSVVDFLEWKQLEKEVEVDE